MATMAMEEHLKRLVGGKITAVAMDDFDDTIEEYGESLYGLWIEMPDGKKYQATSLRDPEGNGAGYLDIMRMDQISATYGGDLQKYFSYPLLKYFCKSKNY